MSQYATIKAIIDQVVTTNGQQEITGALLNEVLKAMVDSLGSDYQFGGVVVPSSNVGTPDQNVFYFAIQAGTYTNFGNVTILRGITIFKWNGSWSHETLFDVDTDVISGSHNLIESGAVASQIQAEKIRAEKSLENTIGLPYGYTLVPLLLTQETQFTIDFAQVTSVYGEITFGRNVSIIDVNTIAVKFTSGYSAGIFTLPLNASWDSGYIFISADKNITARLSNQDGSNAATILDNNTSVERSIVTAERKYLYLWIFENDTRITILYWNKKPEYKIKNNFLSFDNVPTIDSTNLINSGDIAKASGFIFKKTVSITTTGVNNIYFNLQLLDKQIIFVRLTGSAVYNGNTFIYLTSGLNRIIQFVQKDEIYRAQISGDQSLIGVYFNNITTVGDITLEVCIFPQNFIDNYLDKTLASYGTEISRMTQASNFIFGKNVEVTATVTSGQTYNDILVNAGEDIVAGSLVKITISGSAEWGNSANLKAHGQSGWLISGFRKGVYYVIFPVTTPYISYYMDNITTSGTINFVVEYVIGIQQFADSIPSWELFKTKNLYGKVINSLSDSLGNGFLYLKMLEKFGMKIGGSQIGGTPISGNVANAFWQDSRINGLNPDSSIIVVQGGTNDWANVTSGSGFGDIDIDNYDVSTFCGAFNVMISKIYYRFQRLDGFYTNIDYTGVEQVDASTVKNKFMIVIMPPPIHAGNNLARMDGINQINETMIKLAKIWGLKVIDLNPIGFNPITASNMEDKVHGAMVYFGRADNELATYILSQSSYFE